MKDFVLVWQVQEQAYVNNFFTSPPPFLNHFIRLPYFTYFNTFDITHYLPNLFHVTKDHTIV